MPPDDPIIDSPSLDARLDSDWALLRELADVFREDYPRLTESLRLAIAAGEPLAVRTHAHTIKGMASNLSAVRAERAALKIEEMGRSGKLTGEAPGLFDSLCRELEAAGSELRRLVSERCDP